MSKLEIPGDVQDVSDGYHTFRELYAHRNALFVAFAQMHHDIAWRSRKHDDGTSYDGWFIAGMTLPRWRNRPQMITYHLPDSMWRMLDGVETYDRAPKWDGHTSYDVLDRIHEWTHHVARGEIKRK